MKSGKRVDCIFSHMLQIKNKREERERFAYKGRETTTVTSGHISTSRSPWLEMFFFILKPIIIIVLIFTTLIYILNELRIC